MDLLSSGDLFSHFYVKEIAAHLNYFLSEASHAIGRQAARHTDI